MSFDNEGYFSGELDIYKIVILPKFKQYFDFAFRLHLLSQEHKYEYSCNSQDRAKVISTCLYLKILNAYQGCIVLLKNLLPLEATALSRTMCEPLYLIKILLDDESEFWREYINLHFHNVKKMINVAKQNPHEIFELVRDYANPKVIEELNERVKSFDAQKFKIENLAIKARLKNHYDTMFRVTSYEVHTPPDVIFRYVELDENNEFKAFNYTPSNKEYDRVIISISDVVIKATAFMDDFHEIKRHKDFENIINKWQELNKITE